MPQSENTNKVPGQKQTVRKLVEAHNQATHCILMQTDHVAMDRIVSLPNTKGSTLQLIDLFEYQGRTYLLDKTAYEPVLLMCVA